MTLLINSLSLSWPSVCVCVSVHTHTHTHTHTHDVRMYITYFPIIGQNLTSLPVMKFLSSFLRYCQTRSLFLCTSEVFQIVLNYMNGRCTLRLWLQREKFLPLKKINFQWSSSFSQFPILTEFSWLLISEGEIWIMTERGILYCSRSGRHAT